MQLDTEKNIQRVLNDAWLNIDIDYDKLFNPLAHIPEEFMDEPYMYITWLFSHPEYFSFFCSEILNVRLFPFQILVLNEMWRRKFPLIVCSRGFSKSFLLAIHALLRMIFIPGRRIVVCGSGFRQSKIIFDYIESIWNNAPLLRDMVGTTGNGPRHDPDMYSFIIGKSITMAIPIGSGDKIRGLRAHDIFCDEFSSVNRDIFETVIAGFSAVSSSPDVVARNKATKKLAKKLGISLGSRKEDKTMFDIMPNQTVISGTAFYEFNHFCEYWKRWKLIIQSKGDPKKLAEAFGGDEYNIPIGFNWRDYSIIRIPYELIPEGFMDEGTVARARATVHAGIYAMEYGSVFSNDSNGFFKRSLIESCVISDTNEIELPSGRVDFLPVIYGDKNKQYVFGVDPASEVDNFAIVVLEKYVDHQRIVHVWTINRKDFKERLKKGLASETDFYGYCARKIRDLMVRFPCVHISIDSQGGGIAVSEALHDLDKLRPGELPLWPVIDPDKEQDTDGEAGLHILEMINFASADWTSDSNHGLRKDFEDKVCLFPRYDAAVVGLSELEDQFVDRSYDTLEDCVNEIEELKNELSSIIITQTTFGRDRWDTPEVKLPGNKKGRLRKDRYSALLMANMAARTLTRTVVRQHSIGLGGFARSNEKLDMDGPDFSGPSWFVNRMADVY